MKREERKGIGSLNGVTALQIKRNKMGKKGNDRTARRKDGTVRSDASQIFPFFEILPSLPPSLLRLIHACASTARGRVFNMHPRILPWINQPGPGQSVGLPDKLIPCRAHHCAVKTRWNRHQYPHANNSFENLLHGFINLQGFFIKRSKLRAGNWRRIQIWNVVTK